MPLNPRQRVHGSDNKVESERAAFALDLARTGRRVAVVSSGDPGVFAMASAVVEVAAQDYPDVAVRVVPGITAAHAVAARIGAPLGHDFATISLSDRLKSWDVVERRLAAVAEADMVVALYNPASRSRTWQVEAAREVLLKFRDTDRRSSSAATSTVPGNRSASSSSERWNRRRSTCARCSSSARRRPGGRPPAPSTPRAATPE